MSGNVVYTVAAHNAQAWLALGRDPAVVLSDGRKLIDVPSISAAFDSCPDVVSVLFPADGYSPRHLQGVDFSIDAIHQAFNAAGRDKAMRAAYVQFLHAQGLTVDHHGWIYGRPARDVLGSANAKWHAIVRLVRFLRVVGWLGYSESCTSTGSALSYSRNLTAWAIEGLGDSDTAEAIRSDFDRVLIESTASLQSGNTTGRVVRFGQDYWG